MADWNNYFAKSRPPSNLDEAKRTIQDFSVKHRQLGRNIVLVTSGGTTVPIENNTVRFLDNFSQGTRGACSAEYFLLHGYAVVFLHRQRSYEPFCRHFEGHNALDLLEPQIDSNGICRVTVDEQRVPGLADVVRRYKEVQNGCLLLKIGFMTLSDYLFLLRASAEALSPLGSHVMFYLAAAVSDFYIPANEMHEHKVQSSDEGLTLTLTPTPKMLSPLVKDWAKNAYVVSFKLETDVNIISRKARVALSKYNHQVVIANILQTRRKTVVLVTPYEETAIWMSDHELELGKEIEEKIVSELVRRHVALNTTNMDASNHQVAASIASTNFPAQQYQTSLPINTLNSAMPGLAPINIYNTKTGNVLLHLKSTGDASDIGTEILASSNILKRSLSSKEDTYTLSADMQRFIYDFKARRVNLGYTQEDVGKELSALNGPTYSQSFISRFEGKQLGMKAAERMRPILETWIHTKEDEHSDGNKFTKKRRKRTNFSPEDTQLMNEHFQRNPKPSSQDIKEIAMEVNLDVNTVKVWFCNKKQSLKRSSLQNESVSRSSVEPKRKLKSESELSDVYSGAIKTFLPVSTPSGMVNLPFFINQDANGISIVPGTSNQTSQQIVHLSQLPILTSMAVMNTPSNNPPEPSAQILSNARLLSPGSVLQLQNPTSQSAQQTSHQQSEAVIIADGLSHESAPIAIANLSSSQSANIQRLAHANSTPSAPQPINDLTTDASNDVRETDAKNNSRTRIERSPRQQAEKLAT